MDRFEKSIFINRPRQEVFDFTVDPLNDARWQSDIVSSEATSEGPRGVGSTSRVVRKFLGREMDSTIEITAWDPPDQVNYKSVGGPMEFEFSAKYEEQEGGTLLTMTGQAEFGGFFKLASGMVVKQAEKSMGEDMAALKELMEAA